MCHNDFHSYSEDNWPQGSLLGAIFNCMFVSGVGVSKEISSL